MMSKNIITRSKGGFPWNEFLMDYSLTKPDCRPTPWNRSRPKAGVERARVLYLEASRANSSLLWPVAMPRAWKFGIQKVTSIKRNVSSRERDRMIRFHLSQLLAGNQVICEVGFDLIFKPLIILKCWDLVFSNIAKKCWYTSADISALLNFVS